jgi:hypothetical protein
LAYRFTTHLPPALQREAMLRYYARGLGWTTIVYLLALLAICVWIFTRGFTPATRPTGTPREACSLRQTPNRHRLDADAGALSRHTR